jgi:LysM repeat protein
MKVIECLHTDSKCYKAAEHCTPVGIVVHSTGANNPNLKRYVQPSKSDPNYDELIAVIGLNKNGNSWNRSVNKAVHYFIGKLADGSVGTAHVLPETNCAWGVGKGKKGSYNYNPIAHIQFEVCEDDLKNATYFNNIYTEAVALCADICKRWGWKSSVIVSHNEAYKKGYASNHSDIDHWLKKYGKTMKDFRKDVDNVLQGGAAKYRVHVVVKGDSLWKLAKKYLGSGVKYPEIKKLNGLKSNNIMPGQKLYIPNK